MKPGDIVMIFASPVKQEHPIDQAKLIEKKRDLPRGLEEWWVEYTNDPDKQYVVILKNDDGTHE
jgi:hypothetical protein